MLSMDDRRRLEMIAKQVELDNVIRSYRYGRPAGADDPWGHANSLEWATTCPPPRHNFTDLPRIRSERPAFDLHYPHLVERTQDEKYVTSAWRRPAPSQRLVDKVHD